ncbi:MAG: hypothetical protein WBO09_11225, partial [Methylocystis silviterrae]|uniref:hypothetical protein n=1 Tax=Methylocystis silviterrae TaxID=2743612 RepID=UPI003C73D88C
PWNTESRTRDAHDFGCHFPIGSTKKLTERILTCFRVFLSRVIWINVVGIHPPTLRSIDRSINPILTAKYFCVSLDWSAVHGSSVSAI